MGLNIVGQLGDGTYNDTNRPERIMASNVMAVAAGYDYSWFLKSDGSLWGMGSNEHGQLGDGTYDYTNQPEQIMASNVTAIAAGYFHTLFLKGDGSLWGMGWNGYGQLGDGTLSNPLNDTNRPEQIVAGFPGYNLITIQLLSGGQVYLRYVGNPNAGYALDYSVNLAPADWMPVVTNSTDANGVLSITNTPDAATNSFWRVRPVP